VVEHLAPTEVNLDYIEQGTLIESWTSRWRAPANRMSNSIRLSQ
jgi:hypothetical protein